MTDPYSGQLAFFRVYSGKMTAGESIYNVAKGRKERVGRLMRMHANKREDIQEIMAGDICAAVGLKTVSTGDTICDENHPIVLEKIDFPTPVIQLAVEPKTKADQEKMGMAIAKLAQEDPTFRVATDPETGPDHSFGHGRTAPRNHRGPHDARVQRGRECRQTAGRLSRNDPHRRPNTITRTRSRPVAAVSTRAANCAWNRSRARASNSTTTIKGGNIPKEFIPAIEKGVVEALEGGIMAGYPDGRCESDRFRRRVSRSRLFGNGVQDLQLRSASRKRCGKPNRFCSNR